MGEILGGWYAAIAGCAHDCNACPRGQEYFRQGWNKSASPCVYSVVNTPSGDIMNTRFTQRIGGAMLLGSAFTLGACSTVTGFFYDAPTKTVDGMLVGANGMTLYTLDRDVAGSGKSDCYEKCAANWPPFAADGGKEGGDYSVIARTDGKQQWAYKGKPLYFWVKDMKAGDKTGDGFNNVWHVARP
jgi:predicted lipoprotein with Yx(FWY)xxD motif